MSTKIKDRDIETLLEDRDIKVRKTKEFLQRTFSDFKDESFAELTANSVLNSLETTQVTSGMVFRHWLKKNSIRVFMIVGGLLIAAAIVFGIVFAVRSYRSSYYPNTIQVSKNFRFQTSSDSECATGINNVCATKALQEAINEQLNEMKDGDTITINNGKNEIWQITRDKYKFTIVMTRE